MSTLSGTDVIIYNSAQISAHVSIGDKVQIGVPVMREEFCSLEYQNAMIEETYFGEGVKIGEDAKIGMNFSIGNWLGQKIFGQSDHVD